VPEKHVDLPDRTEKDGIPDHAHDLPERMDDAPDNAQDLPEWMKEE
jgi:hypothetical protein